MAIAGTKLVLRVLLVAAVAVACGNASSGTDTPSAVVTTVGSAGGSVTGPGVSIVIPPGALSSEVAITVSDDGVAPPGYDVVGKVYRFSPTGLRFAIPITVTMTGAAPALVFWTLEGSEDSFAPLETTVDAGNLSAKVSHLSSGFAGTQRLEPGTDAGGHRRAIRCERGRGLRPQRVVARRCRSSWRQSGGSAFAGLPGLP